MNIFRFSFNNELPRNTFSLNGLWMIAPGTEQQLSEPLGRTILVPSVVDCAEPALTGRESDYYWYSCDVELEGIPVGSALWLKIEQAQFGTSVWVDGTFAGSSNACYTSQEYRVDTLFGAGNRHTFIVRVGAKHTLPPESAVGRDMEKTYFTPGIWGDVFLLCPRVPRIQNIQIIPLLEREEALARVTLEQLAPLARELSMRCAIREARSGAVFAESLHSLLKQEQGKGVVECRVPMKGCRAWSPDDPFLYEATVTVEVSGKRTDETTVRFGMRDFKIVGNEFHLNGRRIFLKGGNIAFHRFLGDDERKRLPWDMEWVQRMLIEIPQAHHFNFFRFHLGHAYNRWYDLADEHGILLQDEWQFWNATGSNAVAEAEFHQWILDNANHPSIVIWDPLNESTDDSLIHDVIAPLREVDPSRPWESVDFHEQHPYIYSLGMALNQRTLGYTAALHALEKSSEPVVVNEFLWWWFDSEWNPTVLMKDVIERWLGRTYTKEQIIERQQYLAEELVGLFRRMRCAAIQPFVYLSNNKGPTAHWFEGPVSELKPKPLLVALKNAYAPFGVSMELWDRHFCAGDQLAVPVNVFNDLSKETRGTLETTIVNEAGAVKSRFSCEMAVPSMERTIVSVKLAVPMEPGRYTLRCVVRKESAVEEATSQRTFFVFDKRITPPALKRSLALLDPMQDVEPFLRKNSLAFSLLSDAPLGSDQLLFINTFGLEHSVYQDKLENVTAFLNAGGILVVQEPEFRTAEPKELKISTTLTLRIERRVDVDKGGYDSYVFPEDSSHPLWYGLKPEHFQWFNGATGGEIVSEYTITPSLPFTSLASCGLGLRVPAVMMMEHGKGMVIISRVQIRGRLDTQRQMLDRYARRYDPVAARYLLNLVALE